MDIVIISIRAKKFDEIMVIFQPIKPRNPIIRRPENRQFTSGKIIQRSSRKSIVKTITKKRKTPKPKTIRSLLMKPIISSTIMGNPPREKEPSALKLLMISLIFSRSFLSLFRLLFSSLRFLSFTRDLEGGTLQD